MCFRLSPLVDGSGSRVRQRPKGGAYKLINKRLCGRSSVHVHSRIAPTGSRQSFGGRVRERIKIRVRTLLHTGDRDRGPDRFSVADWRE